MSNEPTQPINPTINYPEDTMKPTLPPPTRIPAPPNPALDALMAFIDRLGRGVIAIVVIVCICIGSVVWINAGLERHRIDKCVANPDAATCISVDVGSRT